VSITQIGKKLKSYTIKATRREISKYKLKEWRSYKRNKVWYNGLSWNSIITVLKLEKLQGKELKETRFVS